MQPKLERGVAKMLGYRSPLSTPPEFILEEAMGMEHPSRWTACENCKECQFRMDSLSLKENAKE